MNPDQRPQRLVQLDGLRGIAAFGVVAYHWPFFFNGPALLPFGYLFVDLFFLLSGFVLTPVVTKKVRDKYTPFDFLRDRVRRFWSVAAIGTLIGVAVLSTNPEFSGAWLKLALGLAFIPALFAHGPIFPLNVVQWSLFWELVANYVHARWFERCSDRMLIGIAAVFGALLAASFITQGNGNLGAQSYDWYFAIPRFAFSYITGILIARRFRGARVVPVQQWLPRLAIPLLAVAAIPLLGEKSSLGEVVVVLAIFPIGFSLLAQTTPDARFARPLGYLGKLSFPLYAVHMPLFVCAQLISYSAQSGIVAVAFVTLCAALIAKWLEPGRIKPRALEPTRLPSRT